MLVLAEGGLIKLLDLLIAEYNVNLITVHLFKNDYNPAFGSTLGDFVESNFHGYASQTVASVAFEAVVLNVAYLVAADPLTFTVLTGSAGPQMAFGYWIQDSGGHLLWAERDPDGPINMSSSGNSYSILPRLGLANCPP
jgi:hypothetical protein